MTDATLFSPQPLLSWTNTDTDVFYYEVQLSTDFTFNTDPDTATASVYTGLIHGGAAALPNSYQVPVPLALDTPYTWRVRPRVQGDGAPVEWSRTFSFTVQSGTGTAGDVSPRPADVLPPIGPSSYSLVFVSNRDGNYELYSVKADGTALKRLTDGPDVESSPAVSPDGKRVALTVAHQGKAVAALMNIDGSGLTLVGTAGGLDEAPMWSPTGTRFMFRGKGTPSGKPTIWLVNSDGSGLASVTPIGYSPREPAMSPDGHKLLFASAYTGDLALWSEQLPSGTPSLLFDFAYANEYAPVWSSRDEIAFVSDVLDHRQIWTMTSTGRRAFPITSDAYDSDQPVWSPDGARIAFVSSRDGNNEIYLMDGEGGDMINLSQNPGEDTNPVWSPDGRHIAFVSRRDGHPQVYVVAVDGTGLTNVSRGTGIDWQPSWVRAAVTPKQP